MIPVGARAVLLDDAGQPPLRSILGDALSRCTDAAFAIRRVRLAGIDLTAAELGPLQSCRVLVGRLDADALHDLPSAHDTRAPALERLLRFAGSGRLAVRSAPQRGWSPDFSVLRGPTANETSPQPDLCFVGAHYFYEPDPPDGPAFTAMFDNADAVELAQRRFDDLWDGAYDVLPAVSHALERLLAVASP